MFLMDSSQFEGADFKSDVYQIVSVEHFFLRHEIQDGRQENKMIFNCFTSWPIQLLELFAGVIKQISGILIIRQPAIIYLNMMNLKLLVSIYLVVNTMFAILLFTDDPHLTVLLLVTRMNCLTACQFMAVSTGLLSLLAILIFQK